MSRTLKPVPLTAMLEGVLGSISIANPQHDFIERSSPEEKGETQEQLNAVKYGCEMPFRDDRVRVGEDVGAHEIGNEIVQQRGDCFCQNPQTDKGTANGKPAIKGAWLLCDLI